MAVRVIEAYENETNTEEHGRIDGAECLRVAAYCRVSTDSEEQESSYEAQCTHYRAYIQGNARWRLAGIFADEGISGTSVRNRAEFNRMIEACEAGLIDMIITKSISRFARNTLDCLHYIRRLKDLRIPVLFEKEAINTMDSSGELLLTILASIAQQESKSISDNVRIGIHYKMQQGQGRLNTSRFLGLTKGETPGSLVIEPEGAAVVRRIFREYLEGYSPMLIADRLANEQIPTPSGNGKWYASTIANILVNEKYCGDLLMQKYYTPDFLSHKIRKNTGQLPQYFVKDHHAPIIPREVFERIQREMHRRAALRREPSRIRYGRRQALHDRLFCGRCGRSLKRCSRPNPALTDWRCRERRITRQTNEPFDETLTCESRVVRETQIKQVILQAFNQLPSLREQIKADRDKLLSGQQSAELANREMQLRLMLELIDGMGQVSMTPISQITMPQPSMTQVGERDVATESATDDVTGFRPMSRKAACDEPACYEAEDFFTRTRYRLPAHLMDSKGNLVIFSDAVIIHFLEKVIVREDDFLVRFKCGVEIAVAG